MNRKHVFLLAVVLGGCSNAFESDSSGTLALDQSSYVAASNGAPVDQRSYSFTIGARFTNRSSQTLQLNPGAGLIPSFQLYYENGTNAPYTLAPGVPQIPFPATLFQVAPGVTRVDLIPLSASMPSAANKLSGTFRLGYTGSAGKYFSGPFTVTLSDAGN